MFHRIHQWSHLGLEFLSGKVLNYKLNSLIYMGLFSLFVPEWTLAIFVIHRFCALYLNCKIHCYKGVCDSPYDPFNICRIYSDFYSVISLIANLCLLKNYWLVWLVIYWSYQRIHFISLIFFYVIINICSDHYFYFLSLLTLGFFLYLFLFLTS